jgi:hypothetical protein
MLLRCVCAACVAAGTDLGAPAGAAERCVTAACLSPNGRALCCATSSGSHSDRRVRPRLEPVPSEHGVKLEAYTDANGCAANGGESELEDAACDDAAGPQLSLLALPECVPSLAAASPGVAVDLDAARLAWVALQGHRCGRGRARGWAPPPPATRRETLDPWDAAHGCGSRAGSPSATGPCRSPWDVAEALTAGAPGPAALERLSAVLGRLDALLAATDEPPRSAYSPGVSRCGGGGGGGARGTGRWSARASRMEAWWGGEPVRAVGLARRATFPVLRPRRVKLEILRRLPEDPEARRCTASHSAAPLLARMACGDAVCDPAHAPRLGPPTAQHRCLRRDPAQHSTAQHSTQQHTAAHSTAQVSEA